VKKYLKRAKDSDIEDAFDYMDKDNNRKITFREFNSFFKGLDTPRQAVTYTKELITELGKNFKQR